MAFFSGWFGRGGDTVKAGIQRPYPSVKTEVNDFDTAMTQSSWWAANRLLAETVASMPLVPYKTDLTTGVKEPDFDNELWKLINYQPNQYQTKIEFFEQIMLNLTTWGNAYVAIQRAGSTGRIVSLMPYPSSQIETSILDDGSIVHQYSDANGNIKIFSPKSMWHIKIFGNGIVGLSPLRYAGNALGLSKNLEGREGDLAANGGKTNGILTVDQALNDLQRASVKKSFEEMESGNNAGLFVLEAGFTYQQASLSPTDMQLLESRRFSSEDLARFVGVPSVLINDTAGSTTWGSGVDAIIMGFYKLNLKPLLERIESSMKRWLFDPSQRETTDIEFDFDSLLRADAATRAEANSKRINSAQMSPNEVRATEGLPPQEGGDKLYLNGSLAALGETPINSQDVTVNNEIGEEDEQ